jgi:hypothetical protein
MAEFTFNGDSEDKPVPGSPQGDGDFETDGLPSTGETSSGGQLDTGEAQKGRSSTPRGVPPEGVEKVVDEISTGKIMP